MKLSRVEYEFFEFEAPSADVLELDRQVLLHFEDAPILHISWTAKRQHDNQTPAYSIDFSTASYFSEPAAITVDATSSGTWASLVGKDVNVAFVDAAYQVLRIMSDDRAVFCSAIDDDVVRVSSTSPL